MSTLDACPAADDRALERTAGPVGGATPSGAGADPAAARVAMVARLEEEGFLGPGPVRDALLALPREVLMPQAYVRRSGPGEEPPRWDLLDWSAPQDRPELLGLLYGGASARPARPGAPAGLVARDAVGGVDHVDGDGPDRRAAGRAGSAPGSAGPGRRDGRGGDRRGGLPGLRRPGGDDPRPGPAPRRRGRRPAGQPWLPAAGGVRFGRTGRAGPELRPDLRVVHGGARADGPGRATRSRGQTAGARDQRVPVVARPRCRRAHRRGADHGGAAGRGVRPSGGTRHGAKLAHGGVPTAYGHRAGHMDPAEHAGAARGQRPRFLARGRPSPRRWSGAGLRV